ncbi:hypothetical protein STCU_02422 [Strigomonas culicis]|uniref:BAR domain-containing protein n=1 Tax=Strigomonas culicis TaxID=28005 RepID=S9VUS1_9TRYP|nr:hypothetical protein STCU_03782 [Strigomonas culicis]EPY33207.1 hypothetical protein STCU_02422 [Strigomonas culicis]|eukprot:EPY30921.1 hypothetical protein STCU_03782 [Strigomonas culicis]
MPKPSVLSDITPAFNSKSAVPTKAANDEYTIKKEALKSYKEAILDHDRAVKTLSCSIRSCVEALGDVCSSLQKLSKYTMMPSLVSGAAALYAGVKEVQEGADLHQLIEELGYSKERYEKLTKERKEVSNSRKRRDKAEETYDDMNAVCNKTGKKKELNQRETDIYMGQCQARDAQAIEFRRYKVEFEEDYLQFFTNLGNVVLEDSRDISMMTHKVLSLLSYQFRKFKELLMSDGEVNTEG